MATNVFIIYMPIVKTPFLVLKIHLIELEKVGDLSNDFCRRYIHCLKGNYFPSHKELSKSNASRSKVPGRAYLFYLGKMQSENLLRSPDSVDSSDDPW